MSRITEQIEYLPVTASVLSPPGTDAHLLSFVESFLKIVGRPCTVATGKEMFGKESKFSMKPEL